MATWQLALLLLGVVWGLQSLGVWLQMRHYAKVMAGITETQNDGFLGTGYVRGRLSKGSIALVVTAKDLSIRRVAVMTGRSSFAKFRDLPDFKGAGLQSLETKLVNNKAVTDGEKEAIRKAVQQIERFRLKGREEDLTHNSAMTQTA